MQTRVAGVRSQLLYVNIPNTELATLQKQINFALINLI